MQLRHLMLEYFSRFLTLLGLKRHQRRYVFIVTGIIILLTLFLYFRNISKKIIKGKTIIVVLGGGLTSSGGVPEHTQLRINKAFEWFTQLKENALIITLSGGTPHKPNPLDKSGFPIWEATAAAKKLLEMGVPSTQVYEESFSLDTLGNAYFLRTVHLDPGRYTKLVVITNDWHMDRTRALFDHVLTLPATITSDTECTSGFSEWLSFCGADSRPNKLSIEYISVASGIRDPALLKVRQDKEFNSLQGFLQTVRHEFHSMMELHDWLFTRHAAYSTSRLTTHREIVDSELLKTY